MQRATSPRLLRDRPRPCSRTRTYDLAVAGRTRRPLDYSITNHHNIDKSYRNCNSHPSITTVSSYILNRFPTVDKMQQVDAIRQCTGREWNSRFNHYTTEPLQGSRIRSVRILFSERYIRTLTYSILAYVNMNRIRTQKWLLKL